MGDDGGLHKDPDRRVQQAIPLVFDTFLELGSARQAFLRLREHGIEVPIRWRGRHASVNWRLPTATERCADERRMRDLHKPKASGPLTKSSTMKRASPVGVLRNALAQIPGGTFADRLILGIAVLVIVVMDRVATREGRLR